MDIKSAVSGGVLAVMVSAAAFFGVDSTSDGPNPSTVDPHGSVVAPSPSELSCPKGWTEVMRTVTHVDGGRDVGFISCDVPGMYSVTMVLGGEKVLRDWQGNEIGEPQKSVILGE